MKNVKTEHLLLRSALSWNWIPPFLWILLVTSLPSKFIFYFAAPLVFVCLLFFGKVLDIRHFFALCWLFGYGILSLLLEAPTKVSWLSALLWPLTNSMALLVFVLLFFPPRRVPSLREIRLAHRITMVWGLLQAFIGISQFILSGGNPDAVAGSVGLLDFLGSITINQVYFGFSMLSLLPLFLFRESPKLASLLALPVILLAVALSQSGHATVAFLVALLLFGMGLGYFVWVLRVVVASILLIGSSLIFFPNQVEVALGWWARLSNPTSPKRIVYEEFREAVSQNEKLLILGAGPGQLLSRASLIGGGLLTSAELPGQRPSVYMEEIAADAFSFYWLAGEGSAIVKPYNAYMALIGEWGLLGWAFIVAWILYTIRSLLRAYRSSSLEERELWSYVSFYLSFLALVSLVELYLEMSAAIGVGGWIAVMAAARATQLRRRSAIPS